MYLLSGAAAVVNHLALFEMDSVWGWGYLTAGTRPVCSDQASSSLLCPVQSWVSQKDLHLRMQGMQYVHLNSCQKTITLVACKKGIILFQMLWKKNLHNRNQNQKHIIAMSCGHMVILGSPDKTWTKTWPKVGPVLML